MGRYKNKSADVQDLRTEAGKKNKGNVVRLREQSQKIRNLGVDKTELEKRNEQLRRAQEELHRSEEYLQQIARTMEHVFWMMELNPERVLYVSPAFERIWGRPVAEIYANPRIWIEGIFPEDQARVAENYAAWLEEPDRTKYDVEYRVVRPDGTMFWVSDRGNIVRNSAGEVCRLTGIAEDITERKAAQQALREAKEGLEVKVGQRTAELRQTNEQLKEEIQQRTGTEQFLRLEEARLDALLRLSRMSEAPLDEITAFTLEQAIALTHSKIGFLGFLDENESVYTLHSVSKNVVKDCDVVGNPVHWPVADAGIWAEAIRQRRTLFVNDYSKPHPRKKGIPSGHVPIKKFMVVPVFEGNKIVTVAGVGNKASDYNESDERQVVLLLSGMWSSVQKSRSREQLQKAYDELEDRVKQRTTELDRLNRTFKALSDSNQVMMRAKTEAQYLKEVCEIVVKDCGHKMVWIGFAEEDVQKTVRPAASAGFEKGYLETLQITWADTERGRGPTGTAIRTAKPCICKNMLTDPNFKPWRAEAAKRGYASSAVFPLTQDDKAFGAINIYSTELDAFSQDELQLLTELANDLSYGITALRTRIAKEAAQKELRRERDFSTAVLETAGALVVVLNKEGQIETFNRACEQTTGYSASEVIGRTLWEFLLLPEEISSVKKAWKSLLAGKFPNRHENYWVAKDGSRRLIAWSNTAIVGPRGKVEYVIATGIDITEQRKAEQALWDSEAKYRELVQNANSAIIRWNCDGRITLFNEYAQEFFGYGANEILGKSAAVLVPEKETSGRDLTKLLQDIVRNPQRYVNNINENVCRDGRRVWMAWTNKPIYDENGQVSEILAVGVDITEQKKTQEALQESEIRYRRLFEEDLTGDFIAAPDGTILFCNPAFARIFGFAGVEEAIGTNQADLHPGPESWTDFVELVKRRKVLEKYECERRRRDGTIIYVVENIVGTFDEHGELTQLKGYSFDDTQRKRMEAELENAARFPAENPFPVLRLACDGTIQYSNKPGLAVLEQWDRQIGDKAPGEWCRWTASSLKSNRYVVKEISCNHKTFSIAVTPVPESGYVNLYGRDITRQREYEKQLRKSRDELEHRVKERTNQLVETISALEEEMLQRAQAETNLRVTNALHELFVKKTSRDEYLDSVVEQIREWSGCKCVGIRLTNGEGFIPFESWTGFSDEFLEQENMLSIETDACLCVRAVTQQKESQDIPLATPRGSFRSDNALEFINELSPKDRTLYRGNCIKHGFKSLAVIPIRYRDSILGAIHVADENANMVPLEKVELLENMAMLIGEAVHRFDVEQSLRLSESRLSQAQRIAHLGNWEWEIATGALWWSDEVYRIFGLEPQQFGATYEAFLSYVHPDDRAFVQEFVNKALYNEEPYDIDHRVIRPDGGECIVHEHAEVIYDENHKPVRMAGTVLDVTEQKEAEREILENQRELRVVAAELQLTEERERRQIAQDLHDSIGQILAFSTMALKAVEKTAPEKTAHSLREVSKQLDVAVQQARSLSFDLSPSVLYDLGLEAAIEDLTERYSKERKIPCRFKDCRTPKPLADDVKVLLYRCVRELLINTAKHAGAGVVKVSCLRSSSDVYITVEDDGCGFDVSTLDNRLEKTKGFGMLSIRERLRHIGGQFKVESAIGKGTKVTLIAPLDLE
jgi:PAS domain S-box-containing protein